MSHACLLSSTASHPLTDTPPLFSHLNPAGQNPLQTPAASAVHVANSVVDVLESEGLAAGLDFYGARGHSVFGVAMSDDDEPSTDGGSEEGEEEEEDKSDDADEADEDASSRSGEEEEEDEEEEAGRGAGVHGGRRELRRRLAERDAQVDQLADENMR